MCSPLYARLMSRRELQVGGAGQGVRTPARPANGEECIGVEFVQDRLNVRDRLRHKASVLRRRTCIAGARVDHRPQGVPPRLRHQRPKEDCGSRGTKVEDQRKPVRGTSIKTSSDRPSGSLSCICRGAITSGHHGISGRPGPSWIACRPDTQARVARPSPFRYEAEPGPHVLTLITIFALACPCFK